MRGEIMSIIIADMPMCPKCGYFLTKCKSDVENYCARCGYTTEPSKLPQGRSEHDQRELARLKHYRDGRTDAAPVPCYERGD